MGKINNEIIYVQDTDISDLDYVIGTNGNTTAKTTKNFLLGSLKNYLKAGLSPLTGGTLQLTEITYTGGLYSTFAQVINALDPNVTIGQYHIVVVALNGNKALFKLQDRVVGLGQTAVLVGDFIVLPASQVNSSQVNADWNSTSGVSQILNKPVYTVPTLDTVLGAGYTSNKQILLSDFGASANFNNYQLQFTDNTNKSFMLQSNGLVSRDSPQNSTFLQLPVNALNNVVYKTPLKSAGTYTLATTAEIIAYDGSETKINPGTNITVTGAGTVASPYVVSSPTSASWLPGDTKEVVCDDTYRSANFDSNGLGRLERLGWAIMNGNTHVYNGVSVTVPNDNGKVVISYGTNYATLGATGGSKDAVVVEHGHDWGFNTQSDDDGNGGSYAEFTLSPGSILVGDANNPIKKSGVSGTDKNMQPYVVRLRIVKL